MAEVSERVEGYCVDTRSKLRCTGSTEIRLSAVSRFTCAQCLAVVCLASFDPLLRTNHDSSSQRWRSTGVSQPPLPISKQRRFVKSVSVGLCGNPHLRGPLDQVIGSSGDWAESLTLEPSAEAHCSATSSRSITNVQQ